MNSLWWRVLTGLGGVAAGLFTGLIAAELTGVGAGLGLLFGLADDVLVFMLGGELSFGEVFALQLFLDETEKIIHEAIIWSDEDDAQRDARHAALVRWHGNRVYLFGDVSLGDAALLWWSVDTLADTSLVASVFQVAGEAAVIL